MSSKRQKSRKSKSRDNKGKTMRSREAIKSSKTNCLLDLDSPKGSQVTTKRPGRAPERSPREAQEDHKTIFEDSKARFQKSVIV